MLAPKGTEINKYFEKILKQGTGKKFSLKINDNWTKHTRPLLEAFFHAKYFLEMAVKYGNELEDIPLDFYPSGWAAILYFYSIR